MTPHSRRTGRPVAGVAPGLRPSYSDFGDGTEPHLVLSEVENPNDLGGEAVPTGDLGGPTSVKVYRASESTTIEFHQ